jgi:hypothetical protein
MKRRRSLRPTVLAAPPRADGLRLEQQADGRLWALRPGAEPRAVGVRRSFPWSEPGRFLSLRDDDGHEVALVREPAELDPASRHALEGAMVEAGFVFDVTAVTAIEEEIEIRDWRVVTRQGARRFQTRLDDWPRALPGGGLLVRDVAGDLYRLPEPGRLDRASRDLLWAFVD